MSLTLHFISIAVQQNVYDNTHRFYWFYCSMSDINESVNEAFNGLSLKCFLCVCANSGNQTHC